MMNFEEFSEAILKEIRKKADGEFDAAINNVTKNNGIKRTGIYATMEGSSVGPVIYLDDFYNEYANALTGFNEIVDEVYKMLINHLKAARRIEPSGFLDWETVKNSIYAELVNARQNKERLETMPHRKFLDMAVIYYAVIRGFQNQGFGRVSIRNQHMEMWGQNEEKLYQTAMSNMRSDGKPDFESMESVINRIMQRNSGLCGEKEFQPYMNMYVLTNSRRLYGASEILNNDTMKMIADKLGDGFIVLPSSVHEVIILPTSDEPEYRKLADMVEEVNNTQVDEEERLSYHVYVYIRSEERLKIVA